jgi:hypothetical protein
MILLTNRYKILTVTCLLLFTQAVLFAQQPQPSIPKPVYSSNDTIAVPALVIEGEVIGGRDLSELFIWGGNPKDAAKYWAEWTRLRNAVYVTYPYAKAAGVVMRDVNKHLESIKGKKERKAYIKTREKELRAAFTDHVTELSIYQGIVLMKLINRETGNNCYEIIKEMKGGFTARFYQTIMFFVGSDLKQNWNPAEEKRDRQIEAIVQEINNMYTPYQSAAASASGR